MSYIICLIFLKCFSLNVFQMFLSKCFQTVCLQMFQNVYIFRKEPFRAVRRTNAEEKMSRGGRLPQQISPGWSLFVVIVFWMFFVYQFVVFYALFGLFGLFVCLTCLFLFLVI